jgi:uncharacterized repeat protein (TIGR01451 family)
MNTPSRAHRSAWGLDRLLAKVIRPAGRWSRAHSARQLTALSTSLLLVAAAILALGVSAATVAPAQAAAGDSFDPAAPTVFVAQDVPTRLFKAVASGSGATTFVAEGPAANFQYNAIGYNTVDNFIYATSNTAGTGSNGAAIPAFSLIRIGQNGYVTRVGSQTYGTGVVVGAVGGDGNYYGLGGSTMRVLNPATGAVVRTVTLSAAPSIVDFTFANGFLWSINASGQVVRINPTTGAVSTYAALLPAGNYGAGWTYGNGNLGFSNNTTGTIYQVKVTNPGGATPTFTLVSSSAGPASGNNDGTSSPGLPTDLQIVKTGPATYAQGDTFTYTLTVTNNGAGVSTGYVVSDPVPSPLTNVASATAGCTISGGEVTCVSGTLAAGASKSFTITAKAPASMVGCVTNTASVLANETDPDQTNNSSSVTTCPGPQPEFTCDAFGYLYQTPSAASHPIYQIDLATGAFSNAGSTADNVNAVGYNTLDDYMYGWDITTQQLVRIGSDGSLRQMGVPAGMTAAQATSQFNVGSFDGAGHLWIMVGNTPTTYFEIDLAPGSPTYGQAIKTGAATFPAGVTTIADWAFINGAFYGVSSLATGTSNLVRFAPATGTFTTLGTVPGLAGSAAYGAAYTDAAGYLYVSDNNSGSIYRIDVTTRAAILASNGPAAGGNDGARCALAAIPTITVTKTVNGRVAGTDQFTVGLKDSGGTTLTSATTAGTATTASTTDWPVSQGKTYTITDRMAAGSASPLGAYQKTITCTDTTTGQSVTPGGIAPDWTLTVTDPDAYTCEITNSAVGLALVKQASAPVDVNGDGLTDTGDTIAYTFTVTNTGGTTMDEISVTDAKIGSVTCPQISLAAGESVTCTADAVYTVTDADVTAGSVDNSATATGTPPGGPPFTSTPSTTTTPTTAPVTGITVVKSADPSDAASFTVGQTITYSFVVTNTGNVPLSGVTVNEDSFTGSGTMSSISCPGSTLAAGAQETCTATYTLTQADIDAGSVTNGATATGTPPDATQPTPVSPPSVVTIPGNPAPALTVDKTASPASVGAAGDVITYSFLVTNTGNVTMSDVTVDEGAFTGTGTMSPVNCPAAAATMLPGAQVTCTATYTLTQADVDSGSVTNTATGTGTPPSGPPIDSPPDTVDVTVPPAPALTVVKSADPASAGAVGEVITYSFLVTNTGNVTMDNIAVSEGAFTGTGTISPATCSSTTLAPAATTTCTATYTLTQADVDAGTVTNTATAGGTPPGSTTPVDSPPSTAIVTVQGSPALTVVKTATPGAAGAAGDVVTYSFLVTNTGNVTMDNVDIHENTFTGTGTLSPITCPATTLVPGASTTCTATYTLTQADADSGAVTNTASATGTPPGSTTPIGSPPDTTTVTVPATPAMTVVKSADPASAGAVGDVITYSFLVTNTGNVTVDSVAVNETDFTGTGAMSAVTCPSATLAPAASTTCTATYTLTQADVDSGTVTNTATATGNPPGDTPPIESPPSTSTVTVDPAPGLSVDKTATPATAGKVGDQITYSFLVTNTGNVTMSGISIDDSAFSGSGSLSAISCPATALVASAQMTCTASYTLTQADVDAGSVTNTATASGTPPNGPPIDSPPDTVVVDVPPAPAMTVAKSASVTSPDDFTVGTELTYSFVVTNTGNVTLTDVTVSEQSFSGSGAMSAITCPAGAASLAPGAQVTCTATYTITQADVDAGGITNVAGATGTPPSGPPVDSPPDEVTVPDTPAPALSVVKTADVTKITDVGQKITYSFLVTNTGNVTITGVTVDEGAFTGSGTMSPVSCPAGAASLAPGAQVTCTAAYTTTAADLAQGSVKNTATGTGTPPSGPPITSDPSTVTIGTVSPGQLVLSKKARAIDVDGDGNIAAGDRIDWTITVSNIGGAPVRDISVSDPTGGKVTCPSTTLAPGATMTCEVAMHTITAAEANAGGVKNTAIASGTGVLGPMSSNPGTAHVTVEPPPSSLPDTGANRWLLPLGLAGLMAVLAGTVLVRGRRRRDEPA